MNRIELLFQQKPENILSVYFTAGYPSLGDTLPTLQALAENGVELVEIGIPFSDPLADGRVIQQSSQKSLQNGMSLDLLFEQLRGVRQSVSIPLILMGYLNPVMQFGIENFLKKCVETGIDGVILPDLPLREYSEKYQHSFETYDICNIFLITPQTAPARIRLIDRLTRGFIYMVSSASTTGARQSIVESQRSYFQRIKAMNLSNPQLIGFGISNRETFRQACNYASGAIIGSAFIRAVSQPGELSAKITRFVQSVKN